MKEINIFKGSFYYHKFIESFFANSETISFDLKNNNISKAIFHHLVQFRLAEWKMRVHFNRMVKHQSSGFFQDLICFYLNSVLNKDYVCILEDKIDDIRVDIAIKKENKYIFVIEVKTTTGWDRINKYNMDIYCDRIREVSKFWEIDKNNVMYILENPGNSTGEFQSNFWDVIKMQPKERNDLGEPYSHIYPLFFYPGDPYYWVEFRGMDDIPIIDSNCIYSKTTIIFPFEKILEMIMNSK
jgi:hypothetical protein